MIKCPIIKREIDIGDCVVIVDVCDGAIKERVLGDEILEKKNWSCLLYTSPSPRDCS